MNRSSRGFGLTGVFVAVVILIISAVLSTAVSSEELSLPANGSNSSHNTETVALDTHYGHSRFFV